VSLKAIPQYPTQGMQLAEDEKRNSNEGWRHKKIYSQIIKYK
jgi:hypothetical protein